MKFIARASWCSKSVCIRTARLVDHSSRLVQSSDDGTKDHCGEQTSSVMMERRITVHNRPAQVEKSEEDFPLTRACSFVAVCKGGNVHDGQIGQRVTLKTCFSCCC